MTDKSQHGLLEMLSEAKQFHWCRTSMYVDGRKALVSKWQLSWFKSNSCIEYCHEKSLFRSFFLFGCLYQFPHIRQANGKKNQKNLVFLQLSSTIIRLAMKANHQHLTSSMQSTFQTNCNEMQNNNKPLSMCTLARSRIKM